MMGVPEGCSGYRRLQPGVFGEGGAVAGGASRFPPGTHQGLQDAGASTLIAGRRSLDILRFLAQANISPDWFGHSGGSLLTAALVSCP